MAWEQVRSIILNDRQVRREQQSQPPTNCPNDGTNLEQGPRGEIHCPFDGWKWDGSPITW